MKVKRAIDQGKSAFGGKKEEEKAKDMEDGEEKKKKMTRGKNAPTKFFRGAQEEALSEMPEKKSYKRNARRARSDSGEYQWGKAVRIKIPVRILAGQPAGRVQDTERGTKISHIFTRRALVLAWRVATFEHNSE